MPEFTEQFKELWHKNPVIIIGAVGAVGFLVWDIFRKPAQPTAPGVDNTPVTYQIYPSTGGVSSGGGGVPTPLPAPHPSLGCGAPGQPPCNPPGPQPLPNPVPIPAPQPLPGPIPLGTCPPGFTRCPDGQCIPGDQPCHGLPLPPNEGNTGGNTATDYIGAMSVAQSLF